MPNRKIEWNLLVGFIIILSVWMFFGVAIMDTITGRFGAFVSYGMYLIFIGIIGYMLGNTFHKGIESFLVFISTMVMVDIITPPFVISANTQPTAEILRIWGSDTFVYAFWSGLGSGHWLAWGLTYILTPILGVFILLYFLSGKTLHNKLRVVFNGS